jgi:hypothetical protein
MAIHGLQQPKDNGFDVEASDSNSAYSNLRFMAVSLLSPDTIQRLGLQVYIHPPHKPVIRAAFLALF